jgi:hypothetical protein
LALAADYADDQGRHDVRPEHLLYGVLQDAADPYGTGLGRRGRKNLAQLGWTIGATNPAAAILTMHGLDPAQLRDRLCANLGTAS